MRKLGNVLIVIVLALTRHPFGARRPAGVAPGYFPQRPMELPEPLMNAEEIRARLQERLVPKTQDGYEC